MRDCKFVDDDLAKGTRLSDLVEGGKKSDMALLKVPDPAEIFGSHATACAGLVAGRPFEGTVEQKLEAKSKGIINYNGVDPTAQLISISTPYNHEIRPIILALLYAVDQGAKVILMPRGVNPREYRDSPDPFKPSEQADPRVTRFDTDPELAADQKLFEEVLAKISTAIPVIVAAGNDGRETTVYPARLVNPGSSPPATIAPHLIVAGAHTARNLRSAYSSGTIQSGVTVYCPSDDAQVVDQDLLRIDERSFAYGLNPENNNTRSNSYSPFGILALDIPGRFGRSEGPGEADDPATESPGRTSRYSVFGGTSAASSILAGLVSLMQRAAKAGGKKRALTGEQVKTILTNWRNTETPKPGEGTEITPLNAVAILKDAAAA